MPLPFMAGSPWVRREHRPGAGPTSRTVFAALDRTLSGARLCGLCVCRGRGGSAFGPETKHLTPPESAPSENAAAASWLGTMGRWDRPARCGVCTRSHSRCRRRWAHKRCSVLHSPARPTKAVRVALVGLRCARCRRRPVPMPGRNEAASTGHAPRRQEKVRARTYVGLQLLSLNGTGPAGADAVRVVFERLGAKPPPDPASFLAVVAALARKSAAISPASACLMPGRCR